MGWHKASRQDTLRSRCETRHKLRKISLDVNIIKHRPKQASGRPQTQKKVTKKKKISTKLKIPRKLKNRSSVQVNLKKNKKPKS